MDIEMNNEPVAWKAYEEVNFSDQYILRWVREGDEYVNRITKEMIEDFKAVVRQQQAEIEALKLQLHTTLTNRDLRTYDGKTEMNNEPVAWTACLGCGQRVTSDSIHTCSPQLKTLTDEEITYLAKRFYPQIGDKLYSQPAKTLTDEEIGDFTHRMVLCCQVHPSSADINVLGLKFIVEDILRKAQEK